MEIKEELMTTFLDSGNGSRNYLMVCSGSMELVVRMVKRLKAMVVIEANAGGARASL